MRIQRQTNAICQQVTGRHIILLNVFLPSVFRDDTRVAPNKHWQPSHALSHGVTARRHPSLFLWVTKCWWHGSQSDLTAPVLI